MNRFIKDDENSLLETISEDLKNKITNLSKGFRNLSALVKKDKVQNDPQNFKFKLVFTNCKFLLTNIVKK